MTRSLSISVLFLASLTSGTMFASSAKTDKVKIVHFSMRNDRPNPVTVRTGDSEVTIAPGQTIKENLRDGDVVVAEAGLDTAPGTVVVQATKRVDGAVVSFHRS